jgi:hypothetical protein
MASEQVCGEGSRVVKASDVFGLGGIPYLGLASPGAAWINVTAAGLP